MKNEDKTFMYTCEGCGDTKFFNNMLIADQTDENGRIQCPYCGGALEKKR